MMPQGNPPPANVTVRLACLTEPADQQTVLDLLDMYARDPLGAGGALPVETRQRLQVDLPAHPACRAFLAWDGSEPVGLALCFLGYSSFAARPLLNIHDFAVAPEARGKGVGQALMEAVEHAARQWGCCRLTLEVRADNAIARRLYRRCGFDPGDPARDALSFWKKNLGP